MYFTKFRAPRSIETRCESHILQGFEQVSCAGLWSVKDAWIPSCFFLLDLILLVFYIRLWDHRRSFTETKHYGFLRGLHA